jgi:acetyltransferase
MTAEAIKKFPQDEWDEPNTTTYNYRRKSQIANNFKNHPDRTERKANLRLLKPAQPGYPAQYVQDWTLKDGTKVTFRPIRPEDVTLMVKFHEDLSDESVYFRWFTPLGLEQRIDPERLQRVCTIDYTNELALVAEGRDEKTGEREILGIGRLTRIRDTNEAELSLLICDGCQRLGLGTELVNRLIKIGHDLKFERIVGDVHPENFRMQKVSRKLGFDVRYSLEEEVTKIALELAA